MREHEISSGRAELPQQRRHDEIALTPLPYKVVTIASGLARQDIFIFVLGSVTSRGLRYFVVAALLWQFGPPIRDWIERRLGLAATLFVVLLIGGFVLIRYVV